MTTYYAALADRVLVGSIGDGRPSDGPSEGLVGHRIECLDVAPGAPERVFAGTVDGGLQRSTDGGRSWRGVGSFADRVTAITVDRDDPDVVWAGTEPSAVYRSADGGDSWTERADLTTLPSADRWSFPPRPDTHHVRWIAVDPRDADRLYVAIEAGAFVRTEDGGETWLDHPSGARRDTHTIRVHPEAAGRVYVAAGDGYAESADGGDSWSYPQDGLDHRYVWGLAVHPEDPDLVVASAATGAYAAHDPDGTAYVYRRSGDGWAGSMAGLPGPEGVGRAVLATDDEAFYALTNRGLYRSPEGREWTSVIPDWPGAYTTQLSRGLAVLPAGG